MRIEIGEEIPGADSWLCFSRARCRVRRSVRGHALGSADCRNREREAAGLQAQGWGSRAASVLGAAGGRRTQIAACAQDWWGSPGSTATSPGAVGAPQLSGAEAVPDGEWCTETRSQKQHDGFMEKLDHWRMGDATWCASALQLTDLDLEGKKNKPTKLSFLSSASRRFEGKSHLNILVPW